MESFETASRTQSPSPSNQAWSQSEGRMARRMEEQTAKLPSDTWLWAAVSSMAISAFLQVSGKKAESTFVGQWAAPFLLLGVYNKLVKIAGSDRTQSEA